MRSIFKPIFWLIGIVLFVCTHVSCTSNNHESILLVMSAESGDIHKVQTGYTLTLNRVNRKTLWFTDRPERKAGVIQTQKIVANWSQDFKGSQPNAALLYLGQKEDAYGVTKAEAIELKYPEMETNDSITWHISKLDGDLIEKRRIQDITLFIDNIPGSNPFIH